MRLSDYGAHARTLETKSGALLFSYGELVAVKLHPDWACFRSPAAILSMATRRHMAAFHPRRIPPVLTTGQFARLVRRVLDEI